MHIDIITQKLELQLYGFESIASNKDYAGTAFSLSNKMWQVVKANGIKNKGKNIWVYDIDNIVFAGVELENNAAGLGLENKNIILEKYAWYKHTGPYHLIKQVGQEMQKELQLRGFQTGLPYIEIYGHWTGNEATTETELLMSLQ